MPPRLKPLPGKAPRLASGKGLGVLALVALALLLALPVYALSRFATSVDWRLLAGVPLACSTFTLLAYRSDKRRAQAGEWRISESTLHLGEFLGGWPGAFLAQRIFRHKTSKKSYQVVFWMIVLLHELAAFDSLKGWQLSNKLLHALQSGGS
jgi:uncharacterized membrane protein YsdA (DUF1294 family)